MLQAKNETPFKTSISMLSDRDGIDTIFAIIKGTYTLEPRPRIADEQVPVTIATEYLDDPATSSIKRPTDISLDKPGSDVVLLGDAHAPGGRPVRSLDVSITVGQLHKSMRVFGDRRWEGNGTTYAASLAEPFVVMPLVWERAFGGKDRTEKGETQEQRNPVGTGYRTGAGLETIDGLALPNIEDPSDPITSWKQTPVPTGVAPVAEHWEPRRSYAGTYDESWKQNRAPYLPTDFDDRFLHIAPLGLSGSGHLRGGEPVDLRGLVPEGAAQFRLPTAKPRVVFQLGSTPNERPAVLDTVILEPTLRRFSLVWRASMQCDKKALRISQVTMSLINGV